MVLFFVIQIRKLSLIVFQNGDIVKQPMKKDSYVPKMYQGWGGVGHVEVGWVMQGLGGVGHVGVGWVMQEWGEVGQVGVG